MRVRAAFVALAAIGGLAAVGCTPPPTGGGGSTTTTTTGGLANPTAGCYDSTGNDFTYSGTPNVLGNLHETASTNGTCTGGDVSTTGILVLADDEPQASADCFGLGRESAYSPADIGVTMPSSAWFCTDS
jgi:hypothetical protein